MTLRCAVQRAAVRGAAVGRATLVGILLLAASHPALAQRARGRAALPGADAAAGEQLAGTPAEIQRMFDSYALIQAQDQLKISDDRFPQFLSRFKALQDVRRKNLVERLRVVQELRRLSNDPQSDETQIKERLKVLDELDTRTQGEVAKAFDAINQVLDVRQQAKFRVFEENMERRKLELVTRARQANRPKQ